MHLFTNAQIALKNGIDYATVLDHLKVSRSKGLTVPVLLMGKSPAKHLLY
jgi:tryptophan synthase alpha subunit